MAISKVIIEEGCIVCDACADVCPEVFKVEDTCEVIDGVDFNEYEDEIIEAAESCPVEVIKYS